MTQGELASAANTLEDIRQKAQELVCDGYTPLAEIEQDLCEIFELSEQDPQRVLLGSLVEEVVMEHWRDQANWPEDTDCDRLDRAFAWLESVGIVARQNFTCCNTCGCHEIHTEIAEAQRQGHTVRGYTFFHTQSTEDAVRGCGLYLNYGTLTANASEEACEMIGRMVVNALRDAGLRAIWNGSASTKIAVEMNWQRRRPMPVA